MRKIAIATGLALLLLVALTSIAFAVSIAWGAVANPIYDETGVGNNVLADGDITQLIWDAGADGIDPPGQGGYPTGDDELLESAYIGRNIFFPNTGTFTGPNVNAPTLGIGSQVYVRAWNADSLSAASHYGDSPIFTVENLVALDVDATAAGSFATTSSKPTAVTLSSFTATASEGEILIEWATASEQDLQGFNLYRAESPDGYGAESYVQLNDVLIQPTQEPFGAQYVFPDQAVVAGVRYYYWLEDVEVGGVTHLHGPAEAALAADPAAEHKIYLPLVLRW